MTKRIEKVSSLLQKEIGSALLALDLPALVTVSRVETSPDLQLAKAWITVFPSDKPTIQQVLGLIRQSVYQIQGALNRALSMKSVPKVRFYVDHSEEYASRINQILKSS